MFGELDHIGLFVRDLDAAVAEAREVFGLPVAREATLTQYGIEAVFLGEGSGTLELFTSVDAAALEERLDGRDRRLDHVALRVENLDALVAMLAAGGARFCGPDRRAQITEPLELGGLRHVWTIPDSTAGLALQLTEQPAH